MIGRNQQVSMFLAKTNNLRVLYVFLPFFGVIPIWEMSCEANRRESNSADAFPGRHRVETVIQKEYALFTPLWYQGGRVPVLLSGPAIQSRQQ